MSTVATFWESYWWIIPILMFLLCYFGMRRGSGTGMCGFGPGHSDTGHVSPSDSATDILDKRYALGEISREEYEDRKRTIGPGNK